MKKYKTFAIDFLYALFTSVVIECIGLYFYHYLDSEEIITALQTIRGLFSPVRVCIYWIGLLLILRFFKAREETLDFLFRYRWGIGLAVIVGAVLLKLQGSSIGMMAYHLGEKEPPLFGVDRAIRGDEYVAFTEMALAQVRSGFPWFSDIWGYSPSDMFIVYGQPVRNIVSLYRPFSAGYLLLGAERGLAFYWSARFVFLFLVSFEFARLFTKDKRGLSVLYGIMVSLSPVVQWWYSINELVEIIIFGQAAILLVYQYIHTSRISYKILEMIGLVICAGGYVMSLYPPWMIPFFYVFVAVCFAMLWEERRNIHLQVVDAAIWGCGILIFVLSVGYILLVSKDTILAQMNTLYPGKREYIGGPFDQFYYLFRGWTSWIWTLFEIENPCEEVCFLSFFPFGIILSILVMKEERRLDDWLLSCGLVNIFLILYMCFPLPHIIGKLTFLSMASPRIAGAIGFVNLVMLIRAFSHYKKDNSRIMLSVLIGTIIATISLKNIRQFEVFYGLRVGIVLVCVVVTVFILHYSVSIFRKGFVAVVLVLSILGSLTVNPIHSGLDMIYDTAIVREIERLSQEDDKSWFVNGFFAFENLPTIVGAKSINALATYPDVTLWQELGLMEKEEIWNRYAHFNGCVDLKTDVVLLGPDQIEFHVTIENLSELGVGYILSSSPLEHERVTELFTHNGWTIYGIQ